MYEPPDKFKKKENQVFQVFTKPGSLTVLLKCPFCECSTQTSVTNLEVGSDYSIADCWKCKAKFYNRPDHRAERLI